LKVLPRDARTDNACILAEKLMELDREEERWAVIQGVWVEMLCYSASRCRGYLHAKSMGEGCEFLSIIWLLLSFMGMETLVDRQYTSEPPQEEKKNHGLPIPKADLINLYTTSAQFKKLRWCENY
jgi:hypothetical protein